MRICEVPGCDRKHNTKGYCGTHSYRSTHGLPLDTPIRGALPKPKCEVPGCDRRYEAEGYCNPHRYRSTHGLPLDTPTRKIFPEHKCEVPGCDRKHNTKGYCGTHYYRFQRGLPLDTPTRKIFPEHKCKQKDCDRTAFNKDYCAKHFHAVSKDIIRSTDPGLWTFKDKKKRSLDSEGYVIVRVHYGKYVCYMLEHRVIVAQHYGLVLTDKETVHHKNGIRSDNRIENLDIRPCGMHPPGQSLPDIMQFAMEVIDHYGELFGVSYLKTKGKTKLCLGL